MKRRLAIAFTALLVTSCAHGLALKKQIGIGLQANESALSTARTVELAFYQSHTVATYTADAHIQFIDALLKAQEAERLAILAYQAWDPSQPIPAAVTAYKLSADQVLAILQAVRANPQAAQLITAGQRVVDEAQKLVDLFTKKQAEYVAATEGTR